MHFFVGGSNADIPLVILISGAVLTGIWISNILYDLGVPNYISRKVGHGAGGVAFLAAIAMSSAGWPIILAAGFGIFLFVFHFAKPDMLRGIGGSGRSSSSMAEVWFPLVAVPVFGISWYWLNAPSIAVACLLFMAWGDGITGVVRSQIYHKPVKGVWGSLAMLGICLVIAWVFIKPFWIGAIGSVVAVIVEWGFGDNGIVKWADDNWAIPAFSLGTILGLMALTGSL